MTEQATTDLGKPATYRLWVALDIDHYGKAEYAGRPDKCFRAVLRLENQTDVHDSPFVKTAIVLGGPRYVRPILIAQQDVARYSAKAMQTFAEESLAALRDIANDDVIVDFLGACDVVAALGDEDAA